jgi:hypothetical protein
MAGNRRIPNSFRPEPAKREESKTEEDPKTEAVREALKGNPFAKKYHGKDFNG